MQIYVKIFLLYFYYSMKGQNIVFTLNQLKVNETKMGSKYIYQVNIYFCDCIEIIITSSLCFNRKFIKEKGMQNTVTGYDIQKFSVFRFYLSAYMRIFYLYFIKYI